MPEVKTLGVAVVGLGVGAEHARAFQRSEHCRVRWVYDIDRAQADRVGHEIGVQRAPDFETILKSPEVQAISIASYDDVHYHQVMEALSAGKHVFVEKPLCQNIVELKTIKNIWSKQQGKLKLMSNTILRTAPLYLWLKHKIAEGLLGEVYGFDGDYLYGRLHKIVDGWRGQISHYSAMHGGGIHLIDLMLWLTGERPVEASAIGNRICSKGSRFRFDDYVAATLHTKSGMVSRMTANLGCVHRHQHVVRIFGTKGTFIYDDTGARLHLTREPGAAPQLISDSPLPASKGDLIPDFISAIVNDEDISDQTQSFFDGVSVASTIETALKSQKTESITYV